MQHASELWSFARHLFSDQLQCLTFNYDELLDDFLWPGALHNGTPPDARHGFPDAHSPSALDRGPPRKITKLLKLHGSLDWRVRVGTARPYAIDAIQRFKDRDFAGRKIYVEEQFLERDPFIVPPILTKTELVEQPILRVLWSTAFKELSDSTGVVFVGYSLPTTDIASTFLFREGLGRLPTEQVRIVDFDVNNSEEKRQQILRVWIHPNVNCSNAGDTLTIAAVELWKIVQN